MSKSKLTLKCGCGARWSGTVTDPAARMAITDEFDLAHLNCRAPLSDYNKNRRKATKRAAPGGEGEP